MMRRWISSYGVGLFGLTFLFFACTSLALAIDGREGRQRGTIVGRRIPNIVLPNTAGESTGLVDFLRRPAVVVIFLGTGCPIGNAYLPVISELRESYGPAKLEVIGIFANPGDTVESVRRHVEEFQIPFPVLVDTEQQSLGIFGVQRMCEAFLLDYRGTVHYHGRIDDRFGYDFKRDEPSRFDLRESIDELLAEKKVSVVETETAGCLITRRQQDRNEGKITYSGNIAKLIHRHCTDCHHPGTAAPFSLTSYEDTANWAQMIREVVVQRRMPPWHADPRFGEFANERRLTPAEIRMIESWVEDGSPEGDRSQTPPAPDYVDGWRIGQPDVVFQIPEPFTVPAQGAVNYQYFVTPTHFAEDVWVQAAEPRPGSRAAVHHIIVFHRDPKNRKQEPVWIAATAPGAEPTRFAPGMARKIPAGAELVWQMHYTPTGKVEIDQSEVGFVFAKEPPRHEVVNFGVMNSKFKIPANAADHQVVSSVPIHEDTVLLSMFPHMHLRGRDFAFFSIDPQGQRQQLLSVPQYDFNWQHGYRFTEPLHLPKGSRIECVAHFDNSRRNPANPDPDKSVRFGEQTWDEMMIGYIEFYRAEAK